MTADKGAPNFWGSKIVCIQNFGNSRSTILFRLKIFLRDNNTTVDRGAPNFWGSKIVWMQDFGNSRGTTACVSRLWWAGLVLISEALEVDLGPRGVLLIFLHRRLMSAFSLTARSFAMSRGEAGKPGGGLGRRQIALMRLERNASGGVG
jgi:hypothetical protein